jgi:hypothetical protein
MFEFQFYKLPFKTKMTRNVDNATEELNDHGRQGWQVVATITEGMGATTMLVLQRPTQP